MTCPFFQGISRIALCGFFLAIGVVPLAAEETAALQIVKQAKAVLNPTKGNQAHGIVTFTLTNSGIKVVADIDGLKPGKHGFHIHEFGDCSAPDGSSAGGHYNPTKGKHAGPDDPHRHVGDLGNVVADSSGHAHYERVDRMLELNGPNAIVGRSVIVHADADDFTTQPTGNAGARIACGRIEKQ